MTMKNELRARIFEMTLAAFGASACAGGAQAVDPAKTPAAAEVSKPASSAHGEASCSAAGCGAKADDSKATAKGDTNAVAAPAVQPAAEASPPVAVKSETTAEVTQKLDATSAAAPVAAAPAKPKAKHAKKKSADDEGCGAGSCASAK